MAEAATLLSLKYAGSYQRYETGENRPDAPLTVRIIATTDGQVTLDDLHQQRLDWLKQNRPDALANFPEVISEAAV
ncbi:hypothetical protein [Rhizobium sp. SU303]|uniref:hypothetical protein n=1 Tax=Rhizobium sp. SU303 TaxID=3138065 RepID=UPI001E331DF6|nr:hypothetical protein [Rhizobium leguminosarum]UFW79994.1 hypothetical protein RlegSU303_08775 [Rhizobium leguminosarum bv. viciae]